MSRENLSHVARFDSKPSNQYVYPSVEDLQTKPALHPTWSTMLQTIFEPGKETTMRRNNLKIQAKLLLVIIHTNVVPHRGDKTMHHTPLRLNTLNTQAWECKLSERYHRLKDMATQRLWDVLKLNARPLQPGEHDTFDGEAVVVEVNMTTEEDDGDGDDQPIASMIGRRRAAFDQGTRSGELRRREAQRLYETNEQWNQLHAYNFQREINHRFEDAQMQRMHDQWHAGEPVVRHPLVIDYTSLDPYDGSVRYPQLQVHHSEWLDPYQNQQQQQGTKGSSSSFSFGDMQSMMNSIFGPPHLRYY
ncbi:hypothetical protein E3N88_18327 [Mikania micrantha]|uniref:Uncharacterized protein n=1 Tax=Mikania micrantha TaxID=192012 RepID=A0A5N6NUJ9_9ASTR|nr:hypothetical protein E3N88_18327 [Mikania micrantha]